MASLEVIHAGLMTSVQDLGRIGLGYYAIPKSGVMDGKMAHQALNVLRLDERIPLLECTSIPPQLRFNNNTQIALTGADFNWTINNQKIQRNIPVNISAGDVLKGLPARDLMRGYLAINGQLKIQSVYHSYATYINAKIGGLQGRALMKGDTLEWEDLPFVRSIKGDFSVIGATRKEAISIRKGPEYQLLSQDSMLKLEVNTYQVGPDSNRMGVRLLGEPLFSSHSQLKNSAPVLPGFVQLPPSGLPIVILQDGQTSGGYPRIAYIPEDNLPAFNQIPLGGTVKFRLI